MFVKRRYAVLGLLLWAQFVFGMGMTLWRHHLVLFSGWQVYLSAADGSIEFFDFVTLAKQTCPNAPVIYLSASENYYTPRYSRLRYYLYPRPLIWLKETPVKTPKDWWRAVDLASDDLDKIIQQEQVECLLVDGILVDAPLANQQVISVDVMRYLAVLKP